MPKTPWLNSRNPETNGNVSYLTVNQTMKLFSAAQLKDGDAYTIRQEPISSLNLMERAARRCAVAVVDTLGYYPQLVLLCGPGNNGGDGLVMARLLRRYYPQIHVFCFGEPSKRSPDFTGNYTRLQETGIEPQYISEKESLDALVSILSMPHTLIGDALFGTGLSKPIKDEYYSAVIQAVNNSRNTVFSVDTPSGLFSDSNDHFTNEGSVIEADVTFTFEQPKLSFLFAENARYTGRVQVVRIGIHPEFKSQTETTEFYITQKGVRELKRDVNPFSHKGTFGHAILVGGSKGKAGSIALSTKACIAAGAGLTTTVVPESILPIVQEIVPEAMCLSSGDDEYLTQLPAFPKNSSAIGIGPGLGMEKATAHLLKKLLTDTYGPFVLDADALNILSENKTWISFLPTNTILTPHPKEFDRLTREHTSGYERWKTQVEFSKKYQVYVILKGAHTSISTPFGKTFFNSTGNPGMSTGGTGDVLTGILTGLLAQGYPPVDVCLIGTYIHGLAGDLAYTQKGREALVASDIIHKLGDAFKLTFNE